MLACRNGSNCSNLDCILPECVGGDKVICFAGVIAMEYSHLVFLGEKSCAVEDTHANVDGVLVRNQVSRGHAKVTLQKRHKESTSNPIKGGQLAANAIELVLQSLSKVHPYLMANQSKH